MKGIIAVFSALLLTGISAQAQVQIIAVSTNTIATNGTWYGSMLTVPTNSIATFKSMAGTALLQINTQTTSAYWSASGNSFPLVVPGPATIQILQPINYGPQGVFATFDVEPGPYPVGKTATVGAYSGNVQVTMEMSTDLVNWTAATNGLTYSNSPDARFFRIKLVTNASP